MGNDGGRRDGRDLNARAGAPDPPGGSRKTGASPSLVLRQLRNGHGRVEILEKCRYPVVASVIPMHRRRT